MIDDDSYPPGGDPIVIEVPVIPTDPYVGYSRHLVTDFDAYNQQALSRVQVAHPDVTLEEYTFSLFDSDPLYCWAREVRLFTELMTSDELATVLPLTTAIDQGMLNRRNG